ncbi:50S ribosomal protein L18Ae/60S ribosomal protein L20 and L18a [Phytophthora cactorum]|nr:50S ribosomal protein L18Ae/60S ribosomal protein L20 and L18a [Phytophthora cactorum]
MVSNTNAKCQLPVLTKVRVVGRHCLKGEMPHVLLAIDALLDDFSAGQKAHDIYKRTGSLRLMQYVAAREPIEETNPFYRRYQFNRTVEIAAGAGDLETVKWLVETYKPEYLTKAVAGAAANGPLQNNQSKVVEWLRENAVPRKDSLKKVMEAAAAAGNVQVVEWLFKDCHASAEDALWSAQTNQQWETAKWILENCGIVGPWIDWDLAAKYGALSFLQYLRSRSIGGPGFYTLQIRQFQVVGRKAPTEKEPNPPAYRMKLFAPNPVLAQSRFWYFLHQMKKMKKTTGEILDINEKNRRVVNNYGIWIRYNSRSGTHNMYKEYRDVTLCKAVEQMYSELAGRHRARPRSIQIMRTAIVAAKDTQKTNVQQFHDSNISFPLSHRLPRAAEKHHNSVFKASRPCTFRG